MQGTRCFMENTTNRLANGLLFHHQVHFDIPYTLPGLNNSGSVLYEDSTGDYTPRIASEASLTPSMSMTKLLVQFLEGLMRSLVAMLARPYPLIETFVANGAKAGFVTPNANQFRAPFIDLKPLNGYLLHTIVKLKGFGFVCIAFRRLALDISGVLTTRCRDSI